MDDLFDRKSEKDVRSRSFELERMLQSLETDLKDKQNDVNENNWKATGTLHYIFQKETNNLANSHEAFEARWLAFEEEMKILKAQADKCKTAPVDEKTNDVVLTALTERFKVLQKSFRKTPEYIDTMNKTKRIANMNGFGQRKRRCWFLPCKL